MDVKKPVVEDTIKRALNMHTCEMYATLVVHYDVSLKKIEEWTVLAFRCPLLFTNPYDILLQMDWTKTRLILYSLNPALVFLMNHLIE